MSSNQESVGKTLLVAFVLCIVCAVVVSTAAVSLRPIQEANKLLDKRKNILAAAGLLTPGADVAELFKSVEVKHIDLDTGTEVQKENYDQRKAAKDPAQSTALTGDQDVASIRRRANVAEIYVVKDTEGQVKTIILPVHGYGLWSTLYGFLALDKDASTVVGLGFYDHAETPGLGGEVDNPKWKALWPGKKIFNAQGALEIGLVKGLVNRSSPKAIHQVDGLAGATLTSNGVSNLLAFWLGENGFGPYLNQLRGVQ